MTTHNDDGSMIEDVVLRQESGNYEEQKDHSFGKRSLGFLLLFVCAAVGKKQVNHISYKRDVAL